VKNLNITLLAGPRFALRSLREIGDRKFEGVQSCFAR